MQFKEVGKIAKFAWVVVAVLALSLYPQVRGDSDAALVFPLLACCDLRHTFASAAC